VKYPIKEKFHDPDIPSADFDMHMDRLHDLVVENNILLALEIGVNFGNSTLAILEGMKKTMGFLWSVDIAQCPIAKERVKKQFGVSLDCEVIIMGNER